MKSIIYCFLTVSLFPSLTFGFECTQYFEMKRQRFQFAEDEFIPIIEQYDTLIDQISALRTESVEEYNPTPLFSLIGKRINASGLADRIPDTKDELITDLANSNLFAIRTVDLIVESLFVQTALDIKRGLIRNNVSEDSTGHVRVVGNNVFVQNARYNDYLNHIYDLALSYFRIKSDLIQLDARIDRISFLLSADLRFRKLDLPQKDQFMSEMQFFVHQGQSPKVVADKYFLRERNSR